MTVNIGTAGWSIPSLAADKFGSGGTALERYATRFNIVEINSSFHRPHRLSTWARWRDSSPEYFRFSVKLPKMITHQLKLIDCEPALDEFLLQATTLAEKLAVLLVQLPPSLAFDKDIVHAFFGALRSNTVAAIACEPRHVSWFESEAETLLREHQVSRVAADPAICDRASRPGGSPHFAYWRLHGSPVTYRSSYGDRLSGYAALLGRAAEDRETWCVFDNTASAAGVLDGLKLRELLSAEDARG